MENNLTHNDATPKLDKKDLRTLFFRSLNLQGAFNFERMQGLGFCWAMLPIINKLYKSKDDRAAAYKRHLTFFNTNAWTSGIIFGIVASMEERLANRQSSIDEESIQAVKGGLMGPLAGIGDSLFFTALRPIIAGISVSMALAGNFLAPIFFIVTMNIIHFWIQWQGISSGYKLSNKFLEKMEGMEIQKWMEAATVVGLMVLGALVASWLKIQTPLVYTMQKATISVQEMLDGILPKALPLLATLLVYKSVKKGINANIIMVVMIVIGMVLGSLGIIM